MQVHTLLNIYEVYIYFTHTLECYSDKNSELKRKLYHSQKSKILVLILFSSYDLSETALTFWATRPFIYETIGHLELSNSTILWKWLLWSIVSTWPIRNIILVFSLHLTLLLFSVISWQGVEVGFGEFLKFNIWLFFSIYILRLCDLKWQYKVLKAMTLKLDCLGLNTGVLLF